MVHKRYVQDSISGFCSQDMKVTAEKSSAMDVAAATPETPQPKPNISMGSRQAWLQERGN